MDEKTPIPTAQLDPAAPVDVPRKKMTVDDHNQAAIQIRAVRLGMAELAKLIKPLASTSSAKNGYGNASSYIDKLEAALNSRFIIDGGQARETPYYQRS